MAVNPEDRYQTASDFREALRRLGRSSGPKAKSISPEFDSTVNPATIKHELAVPVDPFDHYSILKPDETAWLVRKSSSRLRTTVAAMVVMLAVSFGICFGDARWIDSAKSWLNYTRVSSETKDQSVVAASHQEKSDKPRAAAASSANVRVPQVGSADALRKNEKSKRRISRTENPRPRFPKVKPPPISIAP